ncbi:branched-chain amino acid transport system substrate-binding protein [Thermoactinomyces sp. DSM 45891]|uniref:branched-chain amino acid ABC transporter substrate-binding protein n=1 Tax=Thermoactinomyces sp. DSM 45891 TaxID=1761907 RepID=UPI0009218380|nr:branched-chain amino acid ABC transporter substrate-binding protein [Thermoactinomyces sp. DSM 45891]SFX60207.1 branched-chain amino acid transport system substrate-binding protein [Thermoactinomyces sp. DSM 45891]
MKRNFLTILTVFGLVTTTAVGCNTDAGGNNTIKIATQSPLSGSSSTLGEAIKLGAQLALEENQEKFKKLGFTLQLVPFDDQGDPKVGVSNAQKLAADQSILGIVGHLNSGVAIPASSTYENNSIAMVSPANTAVELTEQGKKSVNRIVARDDFQGPAAFGFATDHLKAKNIFIIQDKSAYGQGLAENFKKVAEKKQAKIVAYEGITVGEQDFNGVLNQVVAKKPDLIYFGGLYGEGGLLVKQAREKGINIPVMGGDGFDSSDMVKIAGKGVKNTFYTSVAADISNTPEGQNFVKKYQAKFGDKKSVQSFSYYGYDSMGVILKGLEDSITKNGNKKPTREQVRDAIRAVQDFQGIATKIGFDAKGDNKYAKVFVFQFEDKYPGKQVGAIEKQ